VLRRPGLLAIRLDDRVVLRPIDQPVSQSALCVFNIRITDAEREIVTAPVVLHEDVELTFGSRAVALTHFVGDGTKPEADAVRANQSFVGVEFEFAFAFIDDDVRLFDNLTLPRMNTD